MIKLLLFLCLVAFRLHAMDYLGDIYAPEVKKIFHETAQKRLEIKQDLDVPVINQHKTTLLEYFAHLDSSMVIRLLEAGATPSVTALHSALEKSKLIPALRSAQQMLKYNPKLANEMYKGSTLLRILCADLYTSSKLVFVKLLLSYKANPNTYSGWNETTPLYYLFVALLPKEDENLRIKAIAQRKQIIHELIFHGAQLKTSNISPDFLPTNIVCKGSVYFDLAWYAERKYVFRMLKLMRKRPQDNLIKLLPEDVINYIGQI